MARQVERGGDLLEINAVLGQSLEDVGALGGVSTAGVHSMGHLAVRPSYFRLKSKGLELLTQTVNIEKFDSIEDKRHFEYMDHVQDIGRRLVEVAHQGEFSAQRGLVDEMFPYIYEASQRMSARAISRWLDEEGIKLSAATVAKALRNAKEHWREIWDDIEPAARAVAEAHDEDLFLLVSQPSLFDNCRREPPTIHHGVTDGGAREAYEAYKSMEERLAYEWFSMSSLCREACLAAVNLVGPEVKGETHE